MAGRGEIKGLLSISNNMSISAPDLGRVEEQMATLEHCVVIDPFLSESALRHATVVLPGTTFAEEEGTITTIEGRVVRCDQAVAPVPRRADIDVLRNLARRLGVGHHFDFVRGREVFEEMRTVSAGGPNDYAGHHVGARPRGCVLAVSRRAASGYARGCTSDRFAHPDGLARFHAVEFSTPPVLVDAEYPLVLTTGRLLAHYLSGNQTKRIPAQQQKAPGPYVELHPDTAAALGLTRRGPGRADEPPGSLDRAVEAERTPAHRHRVHAVPLAGVQRAGRRRPRSDEQDPRVQVHADPCQPAAHA